ncbi:MAG: VCBS repeat-containing protein [Melioribacteraceae bacterium]|nr:VCBS repeat-containing protein [Melioribacteraceae bacterium]
MNRKILSFLLALLLATNFIYAQDQEFVRKAVIPVPDIENGGLGNVLSGLDIDGDGMQEIYAVNNNWNDSGQELIPSIYKYEYDGNDWVLVWKATPNIPAQNTWPILMSGDWDKDGKEEIIWGVVNNTSDSNPNPSRILVYEEAGDGSDNLGIADGDNWLPNASNPLTDKQKVNIRPFKAMLMDVDEDGTDELIFADRGGEFSFGVVSVDNIPDDGNGSEVWDIEVIGNELESFYRSAMIEVPENAGTAGFGNAVSGVDFDNDGNKEIYAVNNNWGDVGDELIPQIYKYENNGNGWEIVWQATLGVPLQNTWPALTTGDLDKDGKMEVIWGPVNYTDATSNPNPPRIVVFEAIGDSTDIMGVDDGLGGYKPNAEWPIVNVDMSNERPIRWHVADIDGDNTDEIVFGARAGDLRFGVVSVSDIPDAGDGSETWTLETSALDATLTVAGGTIYDIAILDNSLYLFHSTGDVTPVRYNSGTWTTDPIVVGGMPGGSWLSAEVVDLDSNGTKEMLVGSWSSGTDTQIYLLQEDGASLTTTPIAELPLAGGRIYGGASGDLDNNGLLDFVYSSRDSDPNGIVCRVEYLGGDITSTESYKTTVIDYDAPIAGGRWGTVNVANLDDDADDEILYTSTVGGAAPLVILDRTSMSGSKWDFAYMNEKFYFTSLSGTSIQSVKHTQFGWMLGSVQTLPIGGTFKSAQVADIDGDMTEEMVIADYYSGGIYLLQDKENSLEVSKIADAAPLGATKLTGGASGDIDGDTNIDFVFGSRDNIPNSSVYRIEYKGDGDITSMDSYELSVLDSSIVAVAGQIDAINVANVDDDGDLEIIYTGTPRGSDVIPIVILDLFRAVQKVSIADARIDSDNNFVPDLLDSSVTIIGVITTPNLQANSGDLGHYLQDETAGIFLFAPGDSTELAIGDQIQVTGKITQYSGLTEIVITSFDADAIKLGKGTVTPKEITVPELNTKGEMYEGSLVKIKGVAKMEGAKDWPQNATNSGTSINMWDGYNEFVLRIDHDTNLDENPEPTYPINVTGIASQYKYAEPFEGGYQLIPAQYSGIAQNVASAPNPYFFYDADTKALDGQTIEILSNEETLVLAWHPAVDLNGEDLLYQLLGTFGETTLNLTADGGGLDTTYTTTGQALIASLGGNASVEAQFVVQTVSLKGGALSGEPIVTSVDTLKFTLVDKVTGIEDVNQIPETFYVQQNYPNPFNPATTIKFGLPEAAQVDLRIYNILGQEVATLISNETMNAGHHYKMFNATKFASGTYIYVLRKGNDVVSKKMLLIK